MNSLTHVMTIPAEDLTRQYAQIADEVKAAIEKVLPTGKYVMGPEFYAFEKEFAAYCDSQYALGIANGTEALHLALAACGIGPGDEVLTVPNTYVATVYAISYVGATPVFVDVQMDTFNMDPADAEAKITPRTRAILPVHMYGHPVDLDPLLDLAKRHNLFLIEDAAHAHGATYKGRKTGSFGDVGCFSFYPTKVLGAFGDGGAATVSNPELWDKVRILRYMGQHTKYVHEVIAFQQRLDEIQAAILRVKLRYLDGWIAARRRWAHLYNELLAGLPVVTPAERPEARHVYYVYTIRTRRQQELVAYLRERGIGAHIMYPYLVPFTPAYAHLSVKPGALPVAEQQLKEIVCLPMFPELTEGEVCSVGDAIREFCSQGRG